MSFLISVGEKFPLFEKGLNTVRNQDGVLFEALEDNGGYSIVVCLNKPIPKEIELVAEHRINIRLFQEGNFILPMVQFGSEPMIFEMFFDPTRYTDERAIQLQQDNNSVMVTLVDSSTNIVKALRMANLPLDFIQTCSYHWSKAYLQSDFSSDYVSWYRKLQQLSLESLWEQAKPVGYLGESYNLDETTHFPDVQSKKH